jgi:Pyoverdine/dityrosine biosynthesis protein
MAGHITVNGVAFRQVNSPQLLAFPAVGAAVKHSLCSCNFIVYGLTPSFDGGAEFAVGPRSSKVMRRGCVARPSFPFLQVACGAVFVKTESALMLSYSEKEYRAGLSRKIEPVISSHFMDTISQDQNLQLYTAESMTKKALRISPKLVDDVLLPVLLSASRSFAAQRAAAALKRARDRSKEYGLAAPTLVTAAEAITELMFDRQFSRKANLTRSRIAVCHEIARLLNRKLDIDLVIPALPFKILCPFKARGAMPDFAEVNMILYFYEIAYAIELVAAMASPAKPPVAAHFVVVSDGKRFASIVNVSDETIDRYRLGLAAWIKRLGVEKYVEAKDYWELLHERLPEPMLAEKRRVARDAIRIYSEKLNPIFDVTNMRNSLAISRRLDPDPEENNPEGRFAALFKSLVYTINYRSLEMLQLPDTVKQHLYRKITSGLLSPFESPKAVFGSTLTDEDLRQEMLKEVWQATIEYMAEIKSDRDLDEDPVLVCMPNAVRWTIHPKKGQFAIMIPSVNGFFIQAWAGSGLFRRTTRGAIQLCSYPVLGIEGFESFPVFEETVSIHCDQPIFYVDRQCKFDDIESFAIALAKCVTRSRIF